MRRRKGGNKYVLHIKQSVTRVFFENNEYNDCKYIVAFSSLGEWIAVWFV